MSSVKISASKSKAKSSKPTRFQLPNAPYYDPIVTSQSDLEKSTEDARKRIQKQQLEISFKIESVKNEFKNEVAASKALKSKEGSFLREYYFKKYVTVTPSGTVMINKNFQVEKAECISIPMTVNAYDNGIDLKEDETENLAGNEINENLEEDLIQEKRGKREKEKMLEDERNRQEELKLRNKPNQEEEKVCENEESREEEELSEDGKQGEEETASEKQNHENREEKIHVIKEKHIPEIEKNNEELKSPKIQENRVDDKTFEIEYREEEKPKMSLLQEEKNKINENVVGDDLIQCMIDALETLQNNNNTPVEKKQMQKMLESNYNSRSENSKAKMQEELLARLIEILENQEGEQKPEFKLPQEKRKLDNYDQLLKLHDMLKEYNISMEGLHQHNTNPDESIFPPTTSAPKIPTAMADAENIEIDIEIPISKLTGHQRLILIIDDVKDDEMDEGGQSLTVPITIIQRKNASTSTNSDYSDLLATPRFNKDSDESLCSSYDTAPSESDTSHVSSDLVNLSSSAGGGKLKEVPEETKDMKLSVSPKLSATQSTYGINHELGSTGKEEQTIKKPGRKQKPSFLISNKSIGAFLLPFCGQIFEIENEY